MLAASAILVVSAIGVLAWQGARDRRPPALEARVDSVAVRGEVHHLHLTVRNDGDRSAAAVQLRARLLHDDVVVAESEVVLDWVPGRSAVEATFVFDEDPRALDVEAGIVGFTEP